MDNTLFIGFSKQDVRPMPFAEVMNHYAVVRDAIAGTYHVETHDDFTLVAHNSFIYAFNAYKSASLLLPEMYHESGAVILRQLWEVSLNLHWVGIDPVARSSDFLNFTTIEFRNLIRKAGDSISVEDFDDATSKFQSKFRYKDKQGRERLHKSFAKTTVYGRAQELKDPWEREYALVYNLTSMHAHGAPGAVMHGMMQSNYSNPDIRERNSSFLISVLAIQVMVRNVELLCRLDVIPDAANVMRAYEAFQKMIKCLDASTPDAQEPQ